MNADDSDLCNHHGKKTTMHQQATTHILGRARSGLFVITLGVLLGACGGGGDSGSSARGAVTPLQCTPPPEGPSAPAGPLVIGGTITGRPGDPSFIYVAEGDGKVPFLFYGPDLANSSTITGFVLAGLYGGSCSSVDLTTTNGREVGLSVNQLVYLHVSATTGPPSLSGSIRGKAGTFVLTGGSIPGSSYDMSEPATLASAVGSWTLSDMSGSRVSVTVDLAGNVTGDYGCPFTGLLTPSAESVNLLRLQLSITACAAGAALTGTHEGFALVMPLIGGGSQLLIWAQTNNGVDSSYVLAMGRR